MADVGPVSSLLLSLVTVRFCLSNQVPPFISIYYRMSLNTRWYVDTCGGTPELRKLYLTPAIMSDEPVLYLYFLQEESILPNLLAVGSSEQPVHNKTPILCLQPLCTVSQQPPDCFLIPISILWMSELSFNPLAQQVLDSVLCLSVPCSFWDISRHRSCLLAGVAKFSPILLLLFFRGCQLFSPSACPV